MIKATGLMRSHLDQIVFSWMLLAFLSLSGPIFGQQVIDESISVQEFSKSATIDLNNLLPEKGYDIKALDYNNDRSGQQHHRYQLELHGIPLKGLHLTHHQMTNVDRVITPLRIPASKTLENQRPNFTEQQMLTIARQHVPAKVYGHIGSDHEAEEIRLVYVPNKYDWEEKNWLLAYEIDIHTTVPLQSKRVTLNAENGDLIFIENRLCSIHGVEGTAVTKYHGTQTIETTEIDGEFVLWDQTRGEGIRTMNLNVPDGVDEVTVDFIDDDNTWENFNEDEDEVAGDVHWGSASTWDYLEEKFGRSGLDGEGSEVRSRVHLNDGNAFWNGNVTIYGDGGGSFDKPFTYIDIIAHEMAHGLTQYTSGLIYIRESGGLNEAFSDIIGVSVENYTLPDSVDWRLGEQLSSTGNIIRNMANPAALGMPDTYFGNNWDANLEVHTGSSMANLWYHFLVEGGVGENDLEYAYDVMGIGWEDAQQIAFSTFTNYLRPNSNYRQCAEFSIIAASDLFGKCSQQVLSTKEAWRAVGVLPAVDEVALLTNKRKICTLGDSITFRLNISVDDILWDFGDGGSSTEINPTHIYTQNGTFAFSATGNSCEGGPFTTSGTFDIQVDDGLDDCNIVVLRPNDEQYVTFCEGAFIDDGGLDNNYSNNYYSNLNVAAEGAMGYTVEFVSFNTRIGEDIVQIRVDNGTGFRTQGTFSGSEDPQSYFYEGSRINFSFASSSSFNDEGFEIRWQCIDNLPIPTLAPTFTARDCAYDIDFVANSTFSNNIVWDFGDGTTGSGFTPMHQYTHPGTYTVTCTANNSSGSMEETLEVTVAYDEIFISGPHQLLPDVPGIYKAKIPDGFNLISAIWRVDGALSGVGAEPEIMISELGIHEIVLTGQFSNLCRDRDTFLVDVVDELSGIEDLETGTLTILPNPAKDYFQIQNTNALEGNWNIHLVNNLGQRIESYQNNFTNKDAKKFSIPNVAPGLYYLEFENGSSQRLLEKLMILK